MRLRMASSCRSPIGSFWRRRRPRSTLDFHCPRKPTLPLAANLRCASGAKCGCIMKLAFLLRLVSVIFLAGAVGAACGARRQPWQSAGQGNAARKPAQNILRLLRGRDSVTEHSIATAQGKLAYTAHRGNAGLLRSIRQPERRGVLHRLCREGRQPAGDLRLQWRPRRGIGLPASRAGRPARSRAWA